MSRIASEVWARLDGDRPKGESLWARQASPTITSRLVAALDADGRRHLLVLLEETEDNFQDAFSRGLIVSTRELVIPNHDVGRYLDIVCHDSTGHDAFDLIGGEIADRLATGKETAPEVVARVLAKWRRFWGHPQKQILSYNEQIGLFAELWFLSVWLIPTIGTQEAIKRWRGPFGSRHDFEWHGRSIEVKATTSHRGKIHHINGLDQLAPPENGELLFFSLRLRDEGGATNNLPAVITACRSALMGDPDALGQFELALAKAGYLSVFEEDYAQLRVRIIEERLFNVTPEFPRLTTSNFPSGVPSGIERVEYEINLEGCTHLVIASKATEAPLL